MLTKYQRWGVNVSVVFLFIFFGFLFWTYYYKYPILFFQMESFEKTREFIDSVGKIAYENNFLNFRNSYYDKFGKKVNWYPSRELITSFTNLQGPITRYEFYGSIQRVFQDATSMEVLMFTGDNFKFDPISVPQLTVIWQEKPGDFPDIDYYESLPEEKKSLFFCSGNVLLFSSTKPDLGISLRSFEPDLILLKETNCENSQ